MKAYKTIAAFVFLFVLSIGSLNAYTFTSDETNAQDSLKTISLGFDIETEEINALSVRLKAVGSIVQNVEIVDAENYLILPECDNGEIFESDRICFSIGSTSSLENDMIFAVIDLKIVDVTGASLVKLDGNSYSDGEVEYQDIGEFTLVEASSEVVPAEEGTVAVLDENLDYGTQVYAVASILILLVFVFSLVFIVNDNYSFGLKLTVSFAALVLMVFALYGAYSTYSKENDVSVADFGSTCYDYVYKVCGVDGKTYRNDCIATGLGVDVQCYGACPCSSDGAICGNGVCEAGEDIFRKSDSYSSLGSGCLEDCIVCGDGICDIGEADSVTCDTGTSRSDVDKRFCPEVKGTCPTDCTATKPQETAVCGAMDTNNDGKLTIVDFAAFVKVYQKKCEGVALSTSAKTSCGNQDSNNDGTINIIDFSSFKKRYGLASCSL